jgi:hypothetical protein
MEKMATDPTPTNNEQAGMDWWNGLSEVARAFWIKQTGPSIADAWARHQALAGLTINDAPRAPEDAAQPVELALIQMHVPRELKGAWVSKSRAAGQKLGDWIVSRVSDAEKNDIQAPEGKK